MQPDVDKSPHSRTRIRIQAINVTFKSPPEYSVNLKLLLNNKELSNLKSIPASQALRWEDVLPIDASLEDIFEIRMYELHWWWMNKRKRVGAVQLCVNDLKNANPGITLREDASDPQWEISVTLVEGTNAKEIAQKMHDKAVSTLVDSSSVVECMGKARDAVESIMKVGGALAELHPIANIVFGVCNTAWETLKKQDECDSLVAELAAAMGDVIPYITEVENHAKIQKFKDTIKELLLLVEDASRFITHYNSDGAAVRAVRAFVSSDARSQVDEFVKHFGRLKENLDRGIASQVIQDVNKLLSDGDRNLIEKLSIQDASYDLARRCLEGTRMETLDHINNWAVEATDSPRLFWLHGPAGCGKSSVATSICHSLRQADALAGSFFCRRDNERLRKPENVISHLAASLAYRCSAYGASLVDILRREPELARSATRTQFTGILVRPLRALKSAVERKPMVFIVDGIDECGAVDTREDLVRCLLELSKLTNWLKILVTGRPIDEICRPLNSARDPITHYDLFAQSKLNISRDILTYISSCLRMIPSQALSRDHWPSEIDMHRLAANSNGLFIWAKTACNLISQSLDPVATMSQILAGQKLKGAKKALGYIYTTALNEALRETDDDANIVQLCVGAIVLTGSRRPLPDNSIASMLPGRIKQHTLSRVIDRLGAVIYRDQNSAVRVIHQSFSDYMTENDCPEQYRINLVSQNAEMAAACLRLMITGLRFNMCNLEDSCLMNSESRYDEYTKIAVEVYRFVSAAYHPISASTPHLYVSALAYGAANYSTIKALKKGFPNTLSVTSGIGLWSGQCIRVVDVALPVTSIAVSPDDRRIALGSSRRARGVSNSRVLRILDAHTGQELLDVPEQSLQLPPAMRSLFKLSGDDLLGLPEKDALGTSECNSVVTAESRPALNIDGHASHISSVTFSGDGQRIATGHKDHTILVWDAQTGIPLLEPLRGHSDAIRSVAFSLDGHHIISGSDDATVRIWDVHAGTEMFEPLRGHSGGVSSVALSSNGQHIVSGSDDKTLRIWSFSTGQAIFKPLQGHEEPVTAVAFTSDGQRVVSGSKDKTIRLWDVHTGSSLLQPLRGHSGPVTSIACSITGQHIVSGSEDKTIRTWDALTGHALLKPLCGHEATITCVSFSTDSQRIISGSSDKTIRIWDAHTDATVLEPLQSHSDRVRSVALSNDGRWIASGSDDRTVRIWNAQTGEMHFSPLQGHDEAVVSVAFSTDGNRIVSGSYDNTLRLWNACTGEGIITPFLGHTDWVTSVNFSHDGHRIISGSYDRTARIWDSRTGTQLAQTLQNHSSAISSVVFSPDGRSFASGSYDHTIQQWDAHTAEPILGRLIGHTSAVTSVAYSANGSRIVSGSYDKTVRVWDARIGTMLFAPLSGHSGIVSSVAVASDTNQVASASHDMTLRIWDIETGNDILEPLHGHSDWVTSIAFSADGQRIASASDSRSMRMWYPHQTQTNSNLLEDFLKTTRYHISLFVSVTIPKEL
ncbi:WD40 repeat protein [Ceratobasidium sp. AG-Ba]|nr:WD40 repeat protein [Ceratobasidium sp. AG-Ba]